MVQLYATPVLWVQNKMKTQCWKSLWCKTSPKTKLLFNDYIEDIVPVWIESVCCLSKKNRQPWVNLTACYTCYNKMRLFVDFFCSLYGHKSNKFVLVLISLIQSCFFVPICSTILAFWISFTVEVSWHSHQLKKYV